MKRSTVARSPSAIASTVSSRTLRTQPVNPQVIVYLNRLSDLLFVLARVANDRGASDVLWVPGKNRNGTADERG